MNDYRDITELKNGIRIWTQLQGQLLEENETIIMMVRVGSQATEYA